MPCTAIYVHAYRDLWDSEADPEQKEKTPAPICRKDRGRGSGGNATRIPQTAGGRQT